MTVANDHSKYVCFKHRHVSKRAGKCPTCQTDLYNVGDRARIPRKTDDDAWKNFKEWIMMRRHYNPDTKEYIGPRNFSERCRQVEADKIGKK